MFLEEESPPKMPDSRWRLCVGLMDMLFGGSNEGVLEGGCSVKHHTLVTDRVDTWARWRSSVPVGTFAAIALWDGRFTGPDGRCVREYSMHGFHESG